MGAKQAGPAIYFTCEPHLAELLKKAHIGTINLLIAVIVK
jgi:hypothetical protein